MKAPDLSIVIPAYQEAEVISQSLAQLADWLGSHDYGEVEVIVVVADSPDGTAELATQSASLFKSLRVIPAGPRVGKGRDVRLGMLGATGTWRLFMDADLATPLEHLDQVVNLMKGETAVIVAVRNLWTIHRSNRRKLITKVGNWLAQLILLPGIKDTQCGFKAFRADAAEAVFGQLTIMGWGFDLETLALARHYKYPIAFIAVPDWLDPKAKVAGLSGDTPSQAALGVLRDLIQVRWNLLRRRYP